MSVHYWKDSWKHLDGSSSAPYEAEVNNLSPGEHLLRARVIFDDASTLDTDVKVVVE
jgi:hypothetical protein